MRYLVTGGLGFIGSALCNRLAALGHYVVAFDNFSRASHVKEKLHPAVETFNGDVRNKDDLQKAVGNDKFDTFFHLAFINGTERFYTEPELVLEVAVKGLINSIDVAIENNITKYLLVSTSEVYNEPTIIPTPETAPLIIPDVHNPRFSYSGGKIISELLAIHSKLDAVIFRPHNIYGPNMGLEHIIAQMVEKILVPKNPQYNDGKLVVNIQGTGKETRSFCFIDDAVNEMILASQYETSEPNPIYNIGVEDETTIEKIVNMIANILGVEIVIKQSESPVGSPSRRCPSMKKLTDMGYRQSVSLRDGLEKTVGWYKQHFTK